MPHDAGRVQQRARVVRAAALELPETLARSHPSASQARAVPIAAGEPAWLGDAPGWACSSCQTNRSMVSRRSISQANGWSSERDSTCAIAQHAHPALRDEGTCGSASAAPRLQHLRWPVSGPMSPASSPPWPPTPAAQTAHVDLSDGDLWLAGISRLQLGGRLVVVWPCDGTSASALAASLPHPLKGFAEASPPQGALLPPRRGEKEETRRAAALTTPLCGRWRSAVQCSGKRIPALLCGL